MQFLITSNGHELSSQCDIRYINMDIIQTFQSTTGFFGRRLSFRRRTVPHYTTKKRHSLENCWFCLYEVTFNQNSDSTFEQKSNRFKTCDVYTTTMQVRTLFLLQLIIHIYHNFFKACENYRNTYWIFTIPCTGNRKNVCINPCHWSINRVYIKIEEM